jgi:CRP-like cAMP-binding protein
MATFKIFEDLTKKELSRVFDVGVIDRIQEGEVLFRKGDAGHDMYAELGSGELFGEIAMFGDSHERSADATAKEFSQVLTLNEETFKKILAGKVPKQFLVNIIRLLSDRLLDMHTRQRNAASGGEKNTN